MANEAQVTVSLTINKDSLQYNGRPSSYGSTVNGKKGPSPGAITCSISGTDVDLSQLSVPGLCHLVNLDDTNFIKVGIWDPDTGKFYPLLKLLPGEAQVVRLAEDVGEEFGTGTGTTGPSTNRMRIKADTAACDVVVAAFED